MAEPLHPQLQAIAREIDEATVRARALAQSADEGVFSRRPAEGAWSAAECIAHLNLTTKAFLPLIDETLGQAGRAHVNQTARYRRDLVGTLLAWVLEPPYRMRVKTTAPFVPGATTGRDALMAEFQGMQQELHRRVTASNGLDLGRTKVRSPFSSRMRYNLLSTFSVIAAHQRRHLWQAERALSKR